MDPNHRRTTKLTTRIEGAHDAFIVQYIPLLLSSSTRAWLKKRDASCIGNWADLRVLFVSDGIGADLGRMESPRTQTQNSKPPSTWVQVINLEPNPVDPRNPISGSPKHETYHNMATKNNKEFLATQT
jgi:hypothetical protein